MIKDISDYFVDKIKVLGMIIRYYFMVITHTEKI